MSTPTPPRSQHTGPLRIGVLGAARIAPFALLKHARALPDVEVVAVAEEYQDAAALANVRAPAHQHARGVDPARHRRRQARAVREAHGGQRQ